MATTNFVNGTVVQPEWLNDVDDVVYRKAKETLSIKDFGAVGDGVTDDTAACILAVNAARTAGKPLLCNGLFRLTSTLDLGSHLLPTVRVVGQNEHRFGDPETQGFTGDLK